MHRELPELKSLCQSLWKLVTTAATQQRYKLLGHFIYFQYTVGHIVLEGREKSEGLKQWIEANGQVYLGCNLAS